MTRNTKLLAAASGLAIAMLGSTAANAAGTASGTDITNTVTVSYQVGSVAQTAQTASDTFKVDRKVNLTVAEIGTATTSVAPGQANAVTSFTVTNTSNATLDFALAAAQQSGGAGAHSNTDNFDATNVRIYLDAVGAGAGVFGPEDTLVTYIDELAADASRTVFVVSDIPLARVNADVAAVTLTATAREGGAAASQGAAITQTSGANSNNTVDTVFADAAGSSDGTRDGAHSAKDDYTVAAALLSVVKSSRVISDPVNNTTNPKMIPGAVVEYCIAVSNGAGAATATNVAISDPLPANTSYVTNSIFVNATVTGAVCSAGTAGTNPSGSTVSGALTDIPASTTRGLRFQVTVN